MSRQKTNIDKSEVEEIVSLKVKELGGIKSKLSYNNVWNFNKCLVETKQKRSNGQLFNLYGYTFWASNYNGEDYYGKSLIDRTKSEEKIFPAGEAFTIEAQDIQTLVKKFHNKPDELSKRLIKVFEKDRKSIENLRNQNKNLNDEITRQRKSIELFENGFASMFLNSINPDNSLNDVLSLKKSGDRYVQEEIKNMFNQDEARIIRVLNSVATQKNKDISNNILRIDNIRNQRTLLEDEGL